MKPETLSPIHQIGIIGCGHLGLTLAEVLIDNHFPRENLRVSFSGNPATFEKIRNAGLCESVADNDEICRRSQIIFLAIKPQNFETLKIMIFPRETTVISCMAGISTHIFQNSLGIHVVRIMPSGPDTIRQGRGIVALFPHQDQVLNILSLMGFKVYEVADEELLHPFTAAVCLPAVLLAAKRLNVKVDQHIKALEEDYPGLDFENIFQWAQEIMPQLDTEIEQDAYIRKMMTKGGITEAIMESLRVDGDFLVATRKGIQRSQELAEHIRPS